LFKEIEILPFCSQYILSLSMIAVNNKRLFTKNLEIHSHNTRSANNLHVPAANLTKYKKGAHYMGSKIFNHLPNYIKGLIRAGRWVGRAGPLPRALTSRVRQNGGHRPATR
jgi:hypothetical protein